MRKSNSFQDASILEKIHCSDIYQRGNAVVKGHGSDGQQTIITTRSDVTLEAENSR